MKRIAEAPSSISKYLPRSRHHDMRNERPPREEARKGARRAVENAEHENSQNQPSLPRPTGQRNNRGSAGARSETHHSKRKPVPTRDEPNSRQYDTMRKNGPDQQQPTTNLLSTRSISPLSPTMSWYQAEDSMRSNENNALIRLPPYGQNLNLLIPRMANTNEIIGPSPDPELEENETNRPKEESSDWKAVIDRIFHQLRRASIEFPSIDFKKDISHRSSPEDIEPALHDLVSAYSSLYQINHDFDAALKEKITEYESLKAENEKEKYKTTVVREECASREQRLDGKITQIQQSYHSMVNNYQLQVQRLEGEIAMLRDRHEAEVNKLVQHNREQMTSLEKSVEEEKTKSKRDYDMWRVEISRQHEEEKRQMRNQMTNETQRMVTENQNVKAEMEKMFSEEKLAMENQYKLEMNRMAAEIQLAEEKHKIERNKMQESHDAEILALERKNEQENKGLRDDVEALKGALVKRDHFKALSDHELALRFQDLAKDVDEFARVRWDNGRESNWPFPDKVLHKSENERRTKQYVIQNTLWVIFYERIFCTPFRVFGIEGKSLEYEWKERYDRDPKSNGAPTTCPKPTKDSEKWRYETMKKCLEAISQPLLEWEPNYNVKQGYELSIKEVMEDISQELGKVSLVSSSDKQRVSDLVRKAAKLWLEVGQQRYRAFLLMSDSGRKAQRSGYASLDRDGAQDLVVIPGLRRMGNAQGERLEKDEMVSDCKGRFTVFYV